MTGLFDDLPDVEPSGTSLFDDLPDAQPVAPPKEHGWSFIPEGIAQHAGEVATANFGDEIAAGVGAGTNWLARKLGVPNTPERGYRQILDEIHGRGKDFAEEYPKTALAADVAGAVAPGGIGANFIRNGATWGMRGLRAGVVGGGFGSTNAIGELDKPQSASDYLDAAIKGGGIGFGAGAVGSAAGTALARTVGPWGTDAARWLMDRGVRLTPGQTLGGIAERFENGASSVPFLGQQIRGRTQEGIESLNLAAGRQTMASDLPASRAFAQGAPEAGHDAIAMMRNILRRRYNTIVPRMQGQADQQLQADIAGIRNALPQYAHQNFDDAIQRHVVAVQSGAGAIDGRGMQHALGALRDEGRRLITSPASHAYDHDLGQALMQVRQAMIANASRYTHPRTMGDFNRIQEAYANFTRLRQAASSTAAPGGVFSPTQLHMAVKAGDRSAGKGAMASGEALLQDMSDRAKTTMMRKMADSGTPERAALMGAFLAPHTTMAAAAAMSPLFALYSRAGNAVFRGAATGAAGTRAAIRRAIERINAHSAPAASTAANEVFGAP